MNAALELPATMPPANGQHHALAPASPDTAPQCPRQGKPLVAIFVRGIPSPRDREIFRQVVICRRTKTSVARQFQLSQPRISQICGEVKQWMQEHTPRQTEELTSPQWLNLAENLCRERLETQYALAMEAYEASRGRRQWAGWDQEGNRAEKLPEANQPPPTPLLNVALKATIELARLDGIWGSGDAWAGRNRERLAEFRQQRDADWDAETAAQEAVRPDLRAIETVRISPTAAADEPTLPALASPPEAAYDRLYFSPPASAPAALVTDAAPAANCIAAEPCAGAPERNLDLDLAADPLKRAYAPQPELAKPLAAEPRRLPPEEREKSFRRRRLRLDFFAPLARLESPPPPDPQRINGHAQISDA